MTNIEQTIAAIDATIAARKEQLPAIQSERARIQDQVADLNCVRAQIEELLAAGTDESVRVEVCSAKDALDDFISQLEGYLSSLDELEAEFTRDTLNIGVSGAARTGKSTTLQRITGLNDTQIPSGGLNPVTAVRSEIYNSPRNEAVITLKTEREFIEGYVRPHVANVNEYLSDREKISIGSIATLKTTELPRRLSGTVSVAATDSLKRLREAKASVCTFEGLLGRAPMTVSLDDVRAYVTYPSPEEEQRESLNGSIADRRYLAVKLAQVFCQFPNLGDAKVGLVDLPGLGEIGNSASDIHLKGLEDKVDQIFLVMRPTAAKAFTDAEVGCNLDQLQVIQPAVRRGDLVVAGINKDAQAGQIAADNLRAHFDAEINAGRVDRYNVVDYCAVNDEDVSRIFGMLLDRLGALLPKMDRQKVAYCMGSVDLSAQISAAAEQLVRSMDRVLRAIPSSDRVMKQRIDTIERAIIGQLSSYAVELAQAVAANSEVFRAFVADAEAIHGDVSERIENGLFRYDEQEWRELTCSSKDFYNLYRDEDKRIRYEIIDAYCDLDRFYGVHIANFKAHVLSTVLEACGMDGFFAFGASVPVDERIAKVKSELGASIHDDDLDDALELLASVKFDFRSNVFLQIEAHLAELANPSEYFPIDSRHSESKREILGGSGTAEHKQERLRKYLRYDASRANDAILAALKSEEDRFNKYLAVSIDFFNNYLFGKDEDNFKQVVIRGLIREYKEYVLPDADDASKSPVGLIARSIKDNARALQGGQRPAPAIAVAHTAMAPMTKASCENQPKVPKPANGGIKRGTVENVKESGATISFGHNSLGFAFYKNIPGAKHGAIGLHKGQSVNVRILEKEKSGRLSLEVVV